MKIIKVNKNDTNIRLDNFLMKLYPNLTKGAIFRAIRTNKVKINGKKKEFNYRLQLNDEIKLFLNDVDEQQYDKQIYLKAKPIIDVVYEDDNLLIINKPPKLLIYDEQQELADTLLNRAKLYLLNTNKWNPKDENQFEPCLVHRLDYNTSGLVMVAKTHEASVILSDKIKNKEVRKFYQCLVYGKMEKPDALLEAYLFKPKDGNIVTVSSKANNKDYRYIATKYKVLSYDKNTNTSLLEVELLTGRTHQIRAHLGFIGHPLVGEQKYITKDIVKDEHYKYQCLVAYKLMFDWKTDAGVLNYLKGKTIAIKNIKFN